MYKRMFRNVMLKEKKILTKYDTAICHYVHS